MASNNWFIELNEQIFAFLNSGYDSNHLLAAGILVYFLAFPICIALLVQFSNTFVRLPRNRQTYIVVNLFKAIALIPLSMQFIYAIATGLVPLDATNVAQWARVHPFLCCVLAVYTVTDLSSTLLLNVRMPMSTLLHHVCVMASYVYVTTANVNKLGVYQSIMMFGGFSSLAFCVNGYLAYYKWFPREKGVHPGCFERVFVFYCFVVYLVECLVSWTWQALFLYTFFHYGIEQWRDFGSFALCLFLLFHWVRDDLILMRFLLQRLE